MIRLSETSDMFNLSVLLTSKCTLKCKLCATYTPQQKLQRHYSYETLTKSVSRFMDSVDKKIGIITLSGGEPLMHPQLPELVDFFSTYIDRIEMFEIITNGTIVPDKKLLESLKFSPKVNIMIDDYGSKLSPNVSKIVEAFNSMGINYRVRKYYGEDAYFGGWADLSDISDKNRTETENEAIYNHCIYFSGACKNIIFIINGTAHMCYVNKQLFKKIPDNPGEYVDLLDDSLQAAAINKKLLNLRNRKSLSVCSLCNGFLEDGKRYAPAEQL